MENKSIGRGGIVAPILSFGSAPIGNLLKEVSEEDALGAVAAAWESGVRYFDTAPHYGIGLAERRLGQGLASYSRSEFILSTKVGRLLVPTTDFPSETDLADGFMVPKNFIRNYDYSGDAIKRSIEASLKRMNTDYIDIVYVHDPDNHYEQALKGAFPALSKLRDEGVIKSFGAGMNQSEMLTEFVRNTDLDVVMLAGRYTLLEQQSLDNLLPLALERNVSIVAAGVFNSGLLSKNRPAVDATYDYAPAPAELIAKVNQIADICEDHGVSLPRVAAQFPLGHKAVVNICLGARSREQVLRNSTLFDVNIPIALWQDLNDSGLIRPESLVSFLEGQGL
jgi:D-threo-aldose 1-dehydrogenase